MDINKKNTIGLLFNISVILGITMTVIDPLIPVISERLNIGYDKIGLILLFSTLFSIIATFLSGRLSDRYNIKKIITSGLIMVAIGCLLFGIGLYFNLIIFILILIFFRIGTGVIATTVNSYASKLFYMQHGPIFIKLDFYWYIGSIVGPLAISIFLYKKVDVKYVFIIFFAAIILMMIFFYRYCADIDLNNTNRVCELKNSEHINKKDNKVFVWVIIKNPIIILLCACLFFFHGIYAIQSTWLTAYFSALNVKISLGSAILSLFWIFNTLGVFITSKVISKINEISLLIFCSLAGFIVIVIYCFVTIIYLKIILLIFIAIFYSSFFPLLNSLAVNENSGLSGTILGITISVSTIGTIVYQPISGYTMEYSGIQGINYLLIATSMVVFIIVLILYNLGKKTGKFNFDLFFKKK